MQNRVRIAALLVVLIGLTAATASSQAPATDNRALLKQYTAELQKTPDDNALREKIVKLAGQITPQPPIPEEARRHYVIAKTLLKDAQKPEDFTDVVAEFKTALLAAPWWGDAYGELGMILKSAGRFDEAMAALKLYVASNPGEEKARGAQDEIYIIEAKQKKAAKEADAQAQAQAAVESAARAEEARHQQNRDVVARFKRIVSGKVYDRNLGSASNPNRGDAVGLTEAEFNGKSWWDWGKSCMRFVFEDERILFCFITDDGVTKSGAPSYVGTPNGPSFEDIVWEVPDIKYAGLTESWDGRTMKRRVWGRFMETSGGIFFSQDRPVNGASYDPGTRYDYWWFRAH